MGKKCIVFLAILATWQQAHCVIIILNGTGSSGKTSIARELKTILPFNCQKVTLDELIWQQLIATAQQLNLLPENISLSDAKQKLELCERAIMDNLWAQAQIDATFVYKKVRSLAQQGKDILVDTVIKSAAEVRACLDELRDFPVCMVLVYCPLSQLPARVKQRNAAGIIGEKRLLRWAVQEFFSMYGTCSAGQPCVDVVNKKEIDAVLVQAYTEFYTIAHQEKGQVLLQEMKQAQTWLADMQKIISDKFIFDDMHQAHIFPHLYYDCIVNTGAASSAACAQQIREFIRKRDAFGQNYAIKYKNIFN